MDRYARLRELRQGNAAADDPITPITPDGGDLELNVRCYTSRDSAEFATHRMRLHPDGTAELPHDLHAERIAAALGSFTSCLELVDSVIPALLSALPLISRRARVALDRDARGQWRIPRDRARGCCRRATFPDPTLALEHLRDPRHALGAQSFAHDAIAGPVFAAAEAAWARARRTHPDVNRLVVDGDGIDQLWRAGIHPDDIAALAAPAAAVERPLPATYFVRMRYGIVDPDWFSTVIAARPDGEFAAWLSAREGAVPDARAWAAWLRYGVTPRDAELATERRISPDVVPAVVAATAWPPWLAARNVMAWAAAGCTPTPAHFAALARHGLEHHRPSAAAIDALIADIARDRGDPVAPRPVQPATAPLEPEPCRTELAVLLALLGTRREVLSQVRTGVTAIDYEALPSRQPA